MVFDSSIAAHIVFKGGTSLSKAWNLIDRFSEDIDLALDRSFLGFNKPDHEMTGSQVSKLRRISFKFIAEKYISEIRGKFMAAGLTVKVQPGEIKADDQDPLIIEIYYPSVTDPIAYLQPRVLVEVGSRSLIEPFNDRSFTSFVGEHFEGRSFADKNIIIPSVNPERTFLEKIFLLHETFQAEVIKAKIERKSRHFYDLEKLMDTEFATNALNNKQLYKTIVEHRMKLTPIKGLDYANHSPDKINPIPPASFMAEWKKDYEVMQQSMLYKTSLSFDQLIERIKALKEKINGINF